MKVEVLLSTYNGEKYLNELLESISHQEFNGDIELLIRDDGSSDKTFQIVDSWKNKLNIKFIKGKNLGPRDSFGELIKHANLDFDYFAFCDQDDVWFDNKLDFAVKKIRGMNRTLYFSNVQLVDSDLNPLGSNRDRIQPVLSLEGVITANPALGCTMVMDRELMRELKQVKLTPFFMHDVAAIMLAASTGHIKYELQPSMMYRQHIESVTQGHDFWKNVKNKVDFWFFQPNISISKEVDEILTNFEENINDNHTKDVLIQVKNYRQGINRFKLAVNKKFRVNSTASNRSFILRVILGVA